MIRSVNAALAAALVAVVISAAPAAAHDTGGLFQPGVSDLVVDGSSSSAGRAVWLRVVDADSGEPAQGMRATLSTPDAAGALTEIGLGYFAGTVGLAPGPTVLTVTISAGPGGPLSRPARQSWSVNVPAVGERTVVTGAGRQADFDAALHDPRHAALTASAERGKGLDVVLQAVEDPSLASPLYVRVHARVETRGTGQLDPTPYEVQGWAADATGAETEFVRFSPLDVVDPAYAAGVYGGVVILPHGGAWTLKTALLEVRKRPHDPPVPVTSSELPVTQSGPALAGPQAGVERLARPRANIFNTLVLGLHSLSAAAWALILAALFLLTFERGRALSGWARTRLEENLDRLTRAAWVTTLLVVGTGIYNLYRESPYHRVPTSWSSLQSLLRLPYARPYYLALFVKLAAYAVLLVAGTRLIRTAREGTGARLRPGERPERSPWTVPANGAPARVTTPAEPMVGRVATVAPPVAAVDRPADPEISREPRLRRSWLPVPVGVACGAAIIACVTVLKAVHLLIELTRAAS
jgi:hypothetical protein